MTPPPDHLEPNTHRHDRRRLLRHAAGWGLGSWATGLHADALAAAATIGEEAAESSPAFQTHDLDWTDARRNRAVPARLYLPAAAGEGQRPSSGVRRPLPLVVFSHGIGGSRQGYRYLGSHLAASGMASLHLQHVGSDRQLWSAGNPFALLSRLQNAAREDEAIARVDDARFALSELLRGPWGQWIDAASITAAGHSYGANTALLLAGARVVRDGQAVDLQDRRIRAAVLISAPPFHGEAEPEQILSAVQVPTLHITCTEDVIRIPGYNSGLSDRLSIFEQVGGQPKALSVFEGGSHSVFTDRTRTGGAQANQRIKKATQDLMTAFLQDLSGSASLTRLRQWPQRHEGIVSSFVLRA